MKGTEKQIKWAEEIKAAMKMDEAHLAAAMEHLPAERMEKLMAALDSGKLGENPISALLAAWDRIADSKEDAAWWIEHRRSNVIGAAALRPTADMIIIGEMIDSL